MKARRGYRLDEQLLRKAQRLLGTTTETDTIPQALRRLTDAEREVKLLLRSRGKHPEREHPHGRPDPRGAG